MTNSNNISIDEFQKKYHKLLKDDKNQAELLLHNYINSTANRLKINLLNKIGYNINISSPQQATDATARYYAIINQPISEIIKEHNNEIIQNTFQHLNNAGYNIYTDREMAYKLLLQNVLSKEPTERDSAFNLYLQNYYDGNYKKQYNCNTVFLMGIPYFNTLFQVMAINCHDEYIWKQFLTFYFSDEQTKDINRELISCLSYCSNRNVKTFFYILEKFNNLNIYGNINDYIQYWEFLKSYIDEAITKHIIGHRNFYLIITVPSNSKDTKNITDINIKYLKDLLVSLQKINRQLTNVSVYSQRHRLFIKFIEKNLELINTQNTLYERDFGPKITTHTSYIHNEEFERIKNMMASYDVKFTEISKSVEKGLLYAKEADDLIIIIKKQFEST